MQTIPGIHLWAGERHVNEPTPNVSPAAGRHSTAASLGDWLRATCDSRYPSAHTCAEHACGVKVLLEGYLTGIQGVRALAGSGVADVLTLYLDHGLEVLPRLRGSYTGLILDARTQQAYLFNDRRASRPIFVREEGANLRAGPELAVLGRQSPALASIDPVAVCEFVLFASHYNDRTLFPSVHKLPPASVLTLQNQGRHSTKRYWQLQIDSDRPAGSERDWVEQGVEHMDRACRALRIAGDRPLLLLSGGGDSRAILASLRRTGQTVDCVSYGTDDGDDTPIAKQLADIAGFPFTSFQICTDSLHTRFVDAALRSDGQAETVDTPGLGDLYDELALSHDAYFHGDRGFCSPAPGEHEDSVTIAGPIGLNRAKRFSDLLEPKVRVLAAEAIDQTLAVMQASGRNLHPVDLRDKIYYEQRMANRQNGFAAMKLRQLEQIRPWLDEDFIDFQFALPVEMRIHRKIVRRMVALAAPDLAEAPYATKDSIPQSQTYRRLIANEAALGEYFRVQFNEGLDERLAALFRPGALQRLAASLCRGTPYPVPWHILGHDLPGGWRFAARRYRRDLLHPVRIALRLLQVNLFLSAHTLSGQPHETTQ